MTRDHQISAVVLAAGQSLRMEGRHKLTLDTGGEPMIRRTVKAVMGIAPVEIVVVTGFAAARVVTGLAGLPVRFIHNPRYEAGQQTSVAAGVRSLQRACDAVMVVPGDQCLLTPMLLADLVSAFQNGGHRSIVVPFHKGRRGNPVLFASRHISEIVGEGLNIGCRHLIERHEDDVARIEFESDAYVTDCDTPGDYANLLARLDGELACHS
jgi:molybdenum cofactor cytidylyltransferase